MSLPRTILLLSGKRKSGKDYVADKLNVLLSERCSIIRISEPLKRLYAEMKDLDFKDLLTSGPYKEKYRQEMIIWSDSIRKTDPGVFCRTACESAESTPAWIVSDVRRNTDIEWFKKEYGNKVKLIRIIADDSTRRERGWVYTLGCDDVPSECDLDDFTEWDLVISNNSVCEFEDGIEKLMQMIHKQ